MLGTNLFNFQTNSFVLTKGPIFTQLLLADEINRTPPKTQAALLQAMNERIVTIDGKPSRTFLVADAADPAMDLGGGFDVAYAFGVFHHLPDDAAVRLLEAVALLLHVGDELAEVLRREILAREVFLCTAGVNDDPDLRIATSLVDYIFRRMALDYLSASEREELGVQSTGERTQPTLPEVAEQATPTTNLQPTLPVHATKPARRAVYRFMGALNSARS